MRPRANTHTANILRRWNSRSAAKRCRARSTRSEQQPSTQRTSDRTLRMPSSKPCPVRGLLPSTPKTVGREGYGENKHHAPAETSQALSGDKAQDLRRAVERRREGRRAIGRRPRTKIAFAVPVVARMHLSEEALPKFPQPAWTGPGQNCNRETRGSYGV